MINPFQYGCWLENGMGTLVVDCDPGNSPVKDGHFDGEDQRGWIEYAFCLPGINYIQFQASSGRK
jgi:hypothetical protein